jgi:hypothetical protein
LGARAFVGCWKLHTLNVPAALTTFDNRTAWYSSRYNNASIFTGCHKIPLAARAKLEAQGYTGGGF